MAQSPHLLIVKAPYYKDISDALVAGARAAVEDAGGSVSVISVPGALEIPAAIAIAEAGRAHAYDGYIAIGCVIRGETTHYDYVCDHSARGLQELALGKLLAIGNAILTVENRDQAWVRADPMQKNKGRDAAEAALAIIALKESEGVN